MSTDDTGLENALRDWADRQRRAPDAAPPVIADLLSERRRRHGIAAVAASVVLVAALGAGLGFGLPGRAHTASPAGPPHHLQTPVATGNGPCWQQFTDAGSRFRGVSGIVVLRYTGSSGCRVFEQPQLALVGARANVVGPHAPTATLNRVAVVEPGDTVRLIVHVATVCVSSVGNYSLSVYFRPLARPSLATGIDVPLGVLRRRAAPSSSCAMLDSAAHASRMQVVAANVTSTLSKLTRIAQREASANGDASASAEAVHTTYGPVETGILHGTSSSPSRSAPVWVVQLHGRFVCSSCSRPSGASAPRGNSIVLVLQQAQLRPIDVELGARSHDLSTLGTVVPLIP